MLLGIYLGSLAIAVQTQFSIYAVATWVARTEAGHFLQEEVPDVLAEGIREVASRI